MQLFLVFFGAPVLGFDVSPWIAAGIALVLNTSAFLGEIWRGCIQAIPRGQWEAAEALGLRYVARMRRVILPQAWRIALPPTVGYVVQVIKGTSLAAIIGFTEITRAGPDHQQRHLPAADRLQRRRGHLFRAVLAAVVAGPAASNANAHGAGPLTRLHTVLTHPGDLTMTTLQPPPPPRHHRRPRLQRAARRLGARWPSAQTADEIKKKGTITVGMLVDFPPYGTVDAQQPARRLRRRRRPAAGQGPGRQARTWCPSPARTASPSC